VRLRKYQRTEMVPVTKEEVRVERTTAEGDVRTERGTTQTQERR
jgi:stress response protein YsnF